MANKAKSIIFVDASIEAPLQLAAGIAFDAEILILSPQADGVAQITAALQSRPHAADISIVAHGAPGRLVLGNGELSLSTLPRHRDRLQQWTAPTQITAIHIYGCNVAAGDAGVEFLTALHTLTQASIAASTHLLGHADRGGDWTLDAFWGEVARRSLLTAEAAATYPGILNDNVAAADPLAPNTTETGDNSGASGELNEPIHDPLLADADNQDIIDLATNSLWWEWLSDRDGLVNVNTEGSAIGTVLAVYADPTNAATPNFATFVGVGNDSVATGAEAASVTFNATNGVTYYFAVDGTGFQTTTTADGISITLDTPPQITAGQLFSIPEYIGDGTTPTFTGSAQVVADPQLDVNTWAITGGNLDNNGNNQPAFAIDNDGNLTVNDREDLDHEGFPTNYELTVTATDAAGFTDTESVFIEVTNVNEAPEVVSLSVPSTVSEAKSFTVQGQVFDPDDNIQEVKIDWTNDGTFDQIIASSGLSDADASGNRSFTTTYAYPDNNPATATISVVVTDQDGEASNAVERTVSILNLDPEIDILTPVGFDPDSPVNIEISEDTARSFQLSASDPAGAADPLTWSATSPSAGGSLTGLNPTGLSQLLTYTPEEDFNGTDTFEVQVDDGDGGTDSITINVTVTPEPDAPSGLNLAASSNSIGEGDTVTLSGNFVDPDIGDTFTVTINWNDGTPNTVLRSADGDVTFDAATGRYVFSEPHQFLTNEDVSVVVTVRDSFNETTFASEAIAISNEPPTLSPTGKLLIIDEDTTGTITFTATDATATDFTWAIDPTNTPGQGTAKLSSTGPGASQTITYTPEDNIFGEDNFVVQVSDGDGGTASANVAVFINPVNDDPVNLAVDPLSANIDEGQEITFSGSFEDVDNSATLALDDDHTITVNWGDGTTDTFTKNDTDDDGNPIFDATTLTDDKVTFDNLTHTYDDDGTYTVTITVTDEAGATDSITRTVQVDNVAPTIVNAPDTDTTRPQPDTTDSPLQVTEDTPINFTVVAKDEGVDDVLTWSVINAPDKGTLTIGNSPANGARNFTYTPDPNYAGISPTSTKDDSFTLQVSDGDGGFNQIEYVVDITGENDPPTLFVGNFDITEDESLTVDRSLFDAEDDTDGAADLTFTITGPGASSFLVDNGSGPEPDNTFTLEQIDQDKVTLLYKNEDNLGVDGLAFTVEVADSGGESTSQFIEIPASAFTAKNDDPVFVDQDGDDTNGIQLGDINVNEDGASVRITDSIIAATDEETANSDLSFVVSKVEGGDFLVNGSPGTTFTQAQINAGAVRFLNDGSTTDPSYTITVSDGQGGTTTLTGGGTVTEKNDAPEILVNAFDVKEDVQFKVTPFILNATDEDATDGPGELQFTITGPDSDSFLVDTDDNDATAPVASSTFTLQDILDGDVFFKFENTDNLFDVDGTPIGPQFTIQVADNETPTPATDTEAGNIVNFEAVNDDPVFTTDADAATDGVQIEFTLNEGTPRLINSSIINVEDEESLPGELTFEVTNVEGGKFFIAGQGETTTFTQAQLNSNALVYFVDDGSGDDPTFDLKVTDGDGGFAVATGAATIANTVDDPPTDLVNSFEVTEGQQFQVTTDQLDATDIDTADADLTFTIAGADAASFFLSDDGGATKTTEATGTPPTITFSREDILSDRVYFLYEGEDTPAFTIRVADADPDSPALPAVAGNIVNFTPVNDAPELTVNIPENAGTPEIQEGGSFFIDTTVFELTDAELAANQQAPTDVVYNVSAVDNGFFTDSELEIDATTGEILNLADLNQVTQFTQADVDAGDVIQFVQDGSPEAPSFTVTVEDNGFTFDGTDFPASESDTVTISAPDDFTFVGVNDAPDILVNNFPVTEGKELVVNTSVLKVSDEETLASTALDIEITSTAANAAEVLAAFKVNGTADTTFNYQDVVLGNVTFTYDGEVAPEFTITVTDDGTGSPTSATESTDVKANVSFQNTDDAPVFDDQDGDATNGIQLGDITVTEDSFTAIDTSIISATDADSDDADITFTVSNVIGGKFTLGGTTLDDVTSTFTQKDLESELVFFINNGENTDEVAAGNTPNTISYDIKVSDADPNNFSTNTGSGTITPINDEPDLETNQFNITEGTKLLVTQDVLNVTDVDTPADRLEFTIGGDDSASFFVDDGTTTPIPPDNTFSLQDVIDEKVSFFYEGEETPSFTISVEDLGPDVTPAPATKNLGPIDGNVNFTPVNDEPELAIAVPGNTIKEGGSFAVNTTTFTLTDAELDATPPLQTPDDIVYTYEATNGFFTDSTLDIDATTGEVLNLADLNQVTQFTQQDVLDGDVITFVHDGSDVAPTLKVTVNDNGFTLDGQDFPTSKSDTFEVTGFDFLSTNDRPELIIGDAITVEEGKSVELALANIKGLDDETNALDLTFTATNITNGQFTGDGVTIVDANTVTFKGIDLLQGKVIFEHDDTGETPTSIPAPSFDVKVTDIGSDAGVDDVGDPLAPQSSEFQTVDITVTPFDDPPILNETFGTEDDGVAFVIQENQNFLLNQAILLSDGTFDAGDEANINALDPDTLPENLTYTVSNVLGGFFAFADTPETKTTQFTQKQLNTEGVIFNHNGSTVAPSYTLKVFDGTSSDTEFYTATLVTVNDPPEIEANTLTLSEDTTEVRLTAGNIFATDDETGPANLTYSISNLTNGEFYLDDGAGNLSLITDSVATDTFDLTNAFTQQQVTSQLVVFKYTGSGDAPTYTLTVKDDGTGDAIDGTPEATTEAATINFTQVNDAPEASDLIAEAEFGVFDVTQGGTTLVTAADIRVVDEEDYQVDGTGATIVGDPASIVFTVDDVQNGFFTDGTIDPATGETKQLATFTQEDINLGRISFVHEGDAAPSYELTATDQGLTTIDGTELAAKTFNFSVDLEATFEDTNDAPVLKNNQLTLDEGDADVLIQAANLSATDAETSAFELTFTIDDIANGFFTVDDGTTKTFFGDASSIDGTDLDPDDTTPLATSGTFTYEDVLLDRVTFTHDGTEDEPAYSVQVMDTDVLGTGTITTDKEFATITFDRVNDAPTFQQTTGADAGDPLVPLTVAEGGQVLVTLANIDAIDEPGETPRADLTFKISEVLGGDFIDVLGNITGTAGQALTDADTFTVANIQAGDLRFDNNPDSNDPPTYKVTVTDDDPLGDESTSETFTGELTAANDAPQQVTLSTIALTEGEAFTIDDTVLKYIDEESEAIGLTYTVTAIAGAAFKVNGETKTSFNQADINNKLVTLVDDGEDDAPPTFTLELSDEPLEDPTTDPDLVAKTVELTEADFQIAANFTEVNDVPTFADDTPIVDDEFIVDFPEVTENTAIALVSGTAGTNEVKISVIDEESAPGDLKYTVESVTNGSFTVDGTEVTSFTQAQIDDGTVAVEFVPQGDQPPTFTLKLEDNNGGDNANVLTQIVTPTFKLANQAPTITVNTLSPVEGAVIPFTQKNLAATDREEAVQDLTFQIVDVTGGTFFLNGTKLDTTDDGTPPTKFTIFQLASDPSALVFKDDGDEVPPSYKVIVSDGTDATAPTAATIDTSNFAVNDEPTITVANFPLTENQLLELTLANLETEDPDVDDPDLAGDGLDDSSLTYTVTAVDGSAEITGGDFVQLSVDPVTGDISVSPVTTFTQQDVIDGSIGFQVDDVDTAPSFKITVNDGAGGTDSETIVDDPDPTVDDGIDFTPVDDPPEAADDSYTTDEGTPLTSLNVTANDSDDGDPPVLNIVKVDDAALPVTLASGAVVSLNATNNTLNYDQGTNFEYLAAGEEFTETFTYTISDGVAENDDFGSNLTATVTITIEGTNDAPTAVDDSGTVLENTELELSVLDNDTDPDTSDSLSILSIDTTTNNTVGTVTTDGTTIKYDPRGAFTLGATDPAATDVFTYTISDESGATSTATVQVTVNGVNDVPVATDDEFSAPDNAPVTGLNLLSNDTDADGDTLEISQLNGQDKAINETLILTSGGIVTLISEQAVSYAPPATFRSLSVGESREETFQYTVTDGNGGNQQAIATIVVNGVNEAPEAQPDSGFSTIEGTPITLNVLANDTDVDLKDVLSISSVNTAGVVGTITNNGSSLTYTPSTTLRGGQTITENFSYTVSDGQGGTDTASVQLSVTGVNNPPIAVNNSGSGFITDEATTFTTANVLGNDSDPEGTALRLVGLGTSGTQGLVTNNGNGTFTYDPNGAFNTLPVGQTTTDSFTYTIADAEGATDTATVTVTINGLLSGFFDYEQFLKSQNLAAVAPNDVVDVLPLAQLFDERYYLSQNPDVASVVGPVFSSGYQHFVTFGINEGRSPSVLYNESYYLANNPDVAASVASPGGWSSGLQHFLVTGHRDSRRDPSAFFDQSDYLLNNGDIAASVTSPGGWASAFQHYIVTGIDEGRGPNLALFNEQYYRANNPDVVNAGFDPYTHFVSLGQFEGRQPSTLYNEASYLANNPDIAAAVGPTGFPTGFIHYQLLGRFEGREVF